MKNIKDIKNWTLFGAGNFLGDILDAIYANGDKVEDIYLNQEVSPEIISKAPKDIRVYNLKDFKPNKNFYLLAFMDPNKEIILEELSKYNLKFENLIHPTAYIAYNVKLGQGNFIGANSVIAAGAILKDFNFINRSCSVGHDTNLKSFNKFGPGATLSSFCNIGNKNFFGANCTLIEKVSIGDEVIIGAGSVVLKDILEKGTYVGVPARNANKK
jgi:sugar O-acyltransferase (sialic acid O-acetyltransferase NeuD family)